MAKTSPTTSMSKSPEQSSKPSPPRPDAHAASQQAQSGPNAEPAKSFAPPPRPGHQNGSTPDYFSNQVGGSLSLEPNPFEQSFGGAPPDTPNGTKLPSVAALTSPSSLLPGGNATPFNWGSGSLRTGPLSPAMLSGPTNDYFGDTHLRGGFPTPNESSLRTGLTPGGSGSMFPAPSPNTQAVFAQLQSGGATPGTLDFHRTAIAAAASKREQKVQTNAQQSSAAPPLAPTSVPPLAQDAQPATSATASKPETKNFDQDNSAANSLFLLAQGRGSAQPQAPFVVPPPPQAMPNTAVPIPVQPAMTAVPPVSSLANGPLPQIQAGQPRETVPQSHLPNGMTGASLMNGASAVPVGLSATRGRGVSDDGSAGSEESEPASRQNTRGRAQRNSSGESGAAANNRRKAQEAPAKNGPASKKAKTGSISSAHDDMDMDSQSDDDDSKLGKDGQPKQKMTEEEKRKNFLERNRVAALKCRQRKKQWLQNLQTKVELYSSENENLSTQINQLREEIVNLKTLLLAHKDCPITQQQGLHGAYLQQSIEPAYQSQINPYGMAAPMASQPVIAGQIGQRRFS